MVDFGDGSDGELNFTTTTKTYGNMTEGIDYNVSGNTLYLFCDRFYDFTDMTIGAGTIVGLDSSKTTGSVLYISCTGTTTIAGSIRLDPTYTSIGAGNESKTTWNSITGPGVANGGSGGKGHRADAFSIGYGRDGGGQSNGYGGGGGAGGGAAYEFGRNNGGNGGYGGTGGANPTGGAGGSASSGGGAEDHGDNGSQSGGGGGGAAVKNASATGGNGSGIRGSTGGHGSGSGEENWGAGGGGGCGGIPAIQGIHFYLYSFNIIFTGIINTSGGNGGSGSTGGNGNAGGSTGIYYGGAGGGGGGGAGGGGGNAGNVYFEYAYITDTGTDTKSGGSGGGIGGHGGYVLTGLGSISGGTSAGAGSTGSNGSFTGNEVSPTIHGYMKFQSGASIQALPIISTSDADYFRDDQTFRVAIDGTTYCADLVGTGSPDASAFRVQSAKGLKAWIGSVA